MNYDQICAPVREGLDRVEEGLLRLLQPDDAFLAQSVSAILNAGGKRFRPALLLTSAKLFDYPEERAVRIATAVELIHTATLIHDDVIDGHAVRRGIATMNARRGEALSILTGDYVYSKAFEVLAADGDIDVMRRVVSVTNRIARGELRQALHQDENEMTEEKYLSVIADKTASLISCSCRLGAMLGRASVDAADRLERYGHNLGMAFQIIDDILDLTGAEDALGKPIGSDIREGKLTLPLIHTLRAANGSNAQWIRDILTSRAIDGRVMQRLRGLLRQYHGIEYSTRKAQEFADASRSEIGPFSQSAVGETLNSFADYCVSRAS